MIRGILFDLYGTLFVYGDMKRAWENWLHHFHISLKTHGLILSKEEFSKECNRFFGKDEPVLTAQNLTVFENRIKSLCTSLDIEVSDGDIGTIADLIAGKWQKEIKLDLDAIPVLKALKEDKRLGLVSNFDHPRHVHKYLSICGLDVLFETVTVSGDVGVKKPNPSIFEPALTVTGLTPGEVAYVGDTNEDIDAANAAGMIPILINRQGKGTDENYLDFENGPQNEKKTNISEDGRNVRTISNLREILFV